jgi:hypothetical protein
VDARACALWEQAEPQCATAGQAMGSACAYAVLIVLMQSSPIAAVSSLPAVSVSVPAVNVQPTDARWRALGEFRDAAPALRCLGGCPTWSRTMQDALTGLDKAARPEMERHGDGDGVQMSGNMHLSPAPVPVCTSK